MKSLMLSILLGTAMVSATAQSYIAPPDVPATAPSGDFPIHIRILGVRWNHVNGSYQGYGRADLLGPTIEGVDYTFSCSEPFLHNVHPTEFYQARWKKPNQKLEILMQKVGSDHLQRCELKTTVKPEAYGHYGSVAPASPASTPPPTP
jgi:hypothetical protein